VPGLADATSFWAATQRVHIEDHQNIAVCILYSDSGYVGIGKLDNGLDTLQRGGGVTNIHAN
jgi:hypothetical protein